MRLTYLLLSPTFGMHQYTADLANRMAEQCDVAVVTVKDCPPGRYGPAVSLHTPATLSNTGLSAESLRFGRLGQVKRALLDSSPDVVHITGPHLWNLLLVRWLRRRGIPVVHTVHDLDPHHGASYGRLLHLWNGAIIRWADHIVVHGDVYRQRLIDGGRRPDQVTSTKLTHLFVGYEKCRELAAGDFDVSYEPLILFFGRLERYKGIDILIEAFRRLTSRLAGEGRGRGVKLVLAGPGEGRFHELSAGLPNVDWRNHLIGDEEGIELFRRCSVVVLPYRDATQSAVVAAAYFFRKPVIVTAVGALAEYVVPGKTGLVVQPDNLVEELAGAMADLLGRPGYLSTLGQAGRAWYDDWRVQETSQLWQLFQSLAGQ
jgi:starch synthase